MPTLQLMLGSTEILVGQPGQGLGQHGFGPRPGTEFPCGGKRLHGCLGLLPATVAFDPRLQGARGPHAPRSDAVTQAGQRLALTLPLGSFRLGLDQGYLGTRGSTLGPTHATAAFAPDLKGIQLIRHRGPTLASSRALELGHALAQATTAVACHLLPVGPLGPFLGPTLATQRRQALAAEPTQTLWFHDHEDRRLDVQRIGQGRRQQRSSLLVQHRQQASGPACGGLRPKVATLGARAGNSTSSQACTSVRLMPRAGPTLAHWACWSGSTTTASSRRRCWWARRCSRWPRRWRSVAIVCRCRWPSLAGQTAWAGR